MSLLIFSPAAPSPAEEDGGETAQATPHDEVPNVMTDDTIRRLRRWFLAYEAAKENAEPLLATRGQGPEECERVSRLCTERMEECATADRELFERDGRDVERPRPLDLFFAAERDKGCLSCWVTSRSRTPHPECQEKIRRWFDCREALLAYVREILVRRCPRE